MGDWHNGCTHAGRIAPIAQPQASRIVAVEVLAQFSESAIRLLAAPRQADSQLQTGSAAPQPAGTVPASAFREVLNQLTPGDSPALATIPSAVPLANDTASVVAWPTTATNPEVLDDRSLALPVAGERIDGSDPPPAASVLVSMATDGRVQGGRSLELTDDTGTTASVPALLDHGTRWPGGGEWSDQVLSLVRSAVPFAVTPLQGPPALTRPTATARTGLGSPVSGAPMGFTTNLMSRTASSTGTDTDGSAPRSPARGQNATMLTLAPEPLVQSLDQTNDSSVDPIFRHAEPQTLGRESMPSTLHARDRAVPIDTFEAQPVIRAADPQATTTFPPLSSSVADTVGPTMSTGPQQAASSSESPNSHVLIHDQLADSILVRTRDRAEGHTSYELHLDPPDLGRVVVELTDRPAGLEAKILVRNETTLEVIQQSLSSLRHTLDQSGISLSHVDVSYYDGSGSPHHQGQDQHGFHEFGAPVPGATALPQRLPRFRTSSWLSRQVDLLA